MKFSLHDFIPTCHKRIEKLFVTYINERITSAPLLQEAMHYSVYNGGKRVRPLLVYATGLALNTDIEKLDAAACAVELIHSYSLIHDDLPAMDNADLRRGKPACHKQFGEAMAILAGDALQTLAFQIIATHAAPLTAEQRIMSITLLGQASGLDGMAGGQALDIASSDKITSVDKLLQLYQLKTGALLSASVKLGIVCSHVDKPSHVNALEQYAASMGLAFQIQDDLLDIQGTTTRIGKPQGLDTTNNKVTYARLHGIEKTMEKIQELTKSALKSIAPLGKQGQLLVELAEYLLQRTH